MSEEGIHWDYAALNDRPDVSPFAMRLTLPVHLSAYSAAVLIELLGEVIKKVASDDEVVDVNLQYDVDDEIVEEISITTDRLIERFDPRELRERIDAYAATAIAKSSAYAERAQDFIDELTATPPQAS